jgi:Nif-specific regulatory protein
MEMGGTDNPMNVAEPSRGVRELTLLFEISKRLGESLDLESVLKPILELMAEYMEMVRGTLTVLNRKTGEIVIEEAYGLEPEEMAKGKYRVGEGITGMVIDTGKPAIVPRISEEPLFLDRTGSRNGQNKEDIAFICVPIKVGNEVIGALSADRLFSKNVSLKQDVRLLTIIAATISQAARLRQLAEEEIDKVRRENKRLQDELQNRYRPQSIVGNSHAMREVYGLIQQVCRTNTTVLILGESGVGKERVAHAIHYDSNRAPRPFVKINCAALPETLIESELFGHERGAFTGAAMGRKGRFEQADKGTIFLDEIGELPPSIQTKLLRVLQEKEIERLGGNATIKVDVRIITATNRDLESLLREGRLREDLYYRLNVFPVVVPPLRERKTDILLLANHFIEKYTKEQGKEVSRMTPSATDMLMNYHWPGNVRELENCVERAVVLSTDGVIHSYHLPPNLQKSNAVPVKEGALNVMVDGVEKEIIVEALKRSRGNMARAARDLGVTERVMGLRVAKFGINPRQFK